MGDDAVDALYYAISSITGNAISIRKEIKKLPEIAPGGLESDNIIFEEFISEKEIECVVMPKTIKKKRFIKLLMSKGIQKNNAIKIHNEYMKTYGSRSLIGIEIFLQLCVGR